MHDKQSRGGVCILTCLTMLWSLTSIRIFTPTHLILRLQILNDTHLDSYFEVSDSLATVLESHNDDALDNISDSISRAHSFPRQIWQIPQRIS